MTTAAHAVENAASRSPRRAARAHPTIEHYTPSGTTRLQAKADRCACGGACPRCQAKADVEIGEPGDVFEREADAMADRVMRMPNPGLANARSTHGLQRKCDGACTLYDQNEPPEPIEEALIVQGKQEPAGAPAQHAPSVSDGIRQVLASAGQPLPASTRSFFETRFGRDFSSVRVHADSLAGRSARDIAAKAYTQGRHVVFAEGQFAPHTDAGRWLLAHELTHVVQQGRPPSVTSAGRSGSPTTLGAAESHGRVSDVVQRAGDPAAIPPGLACPTDLSAGRPAGTDILFSVSGSTITATHTTQLTAFRDAWVLAGGTDDIVVHGYASTDGDQGPNWTLSCDRAQAVQSELLRLGIPAVRIQVAAHGESTDFGAGAAANRHAVVSSSASILPLPLVTGVLTARDNFARRSQVRFGVGETVDLDFFSFPSRPAADFGGLEWNLAAGTGVLTGVTPAGTATYTAPAAADNTVQLDLRVAAGATAGQVISSHSISIVEPNDIRFRAVPGTAPGFMPGGTIPAGTWGAGFLADVFVLPRDVSFQGVVFGEGVVAGVVSPPGSFLSAFHGRVHPLNTFGPGHGGNATTGTPVSPPRDQVSIRGVAPTGSIAGLPTCGASDVNFAIPWEFSVAGSARKGFATANSHRTSSFFCNATTEKGGAGPFCRRINGTAC